MPLSLVDSTHRIQWEIAREEFDNCQFNEEIFSASYIIEINGQKPLWRLSMYPKGDEEKDKNKVVIFLRLVLGDGTYKVRYKFGIETQDGELPKDFIEKIYKRGVYGESQSFSIDGDSAWGYSLCKTDEFEKYFVENKVTVVASFVIHVEADKYYSHMEVADDFVDDMRSMSSHENLADFTIISGNVSFPCHRVVLATRSEYFEALFRNEPNKKEIKVEESPELVKAMLEFVSEGLIPDNINDKAMDLILMSDMYGLNLLTACETSLVENLSPDKAVETLIVIDKIKHVSKSEQRQKVLTYIRKEADKVVKAEDWNKFVQNYPDLITEIILLYHKAEINRSS